MSDNDEIFKSEANTVRSRTVQGNRNPDCLGTIDQFALLKKLGSGGYGVVYLAEDSFTHVKYALKTILPELKSNVEEMDNLKEKFALVQKLSHPHIAAAHVIHRAKEIELHTDAIRRDLHVSPGDPVMVMRYAPGETLSKWRKRFPRGRVPLEKAVEICRQVADALDYAHRQGVVHRDIKPGNISVDDRNEVGIDVQILDFGLAEQIRTSISRTSRMSIDTSGTRPYMAPEQWSGRDQDGRTDQYALAAVLYELVSGDVPFGYAFSSGDIQLMEQKVLHEPVLSLPMLSDDQNRIIRKALSKSSADRFGSCGEFIDAFSGKVPFVDVPVPAADATSSQNGTGGVSGGLPADIRLLLDIRKAAVRTAKATAVKVRKAAELGGETLAKRFPALREFVSRGVSAGSGVGSATRADAEAPVAVDMEDDWVAVLSAMPEPGKRQVEVGNGLAFEMVEVPAGSFQMGSRNGRNAEPGRQPGVESRHEVTLTVPFLLAAAPVTRGKWRAVMGSDPSKGPGSSDDLPVDSVSWEDCQAFLAKLNENHPADGRKWALPTEAQWEYACRAGTSGPYSGSGRIDEMGWYSGNSDLAAHPIRLKKPNRWGFFDMHGNVWEWCADGFIPSLGHDPRIDPCTVPAGMERVVRGGCWNSDAARCRSASRRGMPRTARFDNVGFRVALVPR